MCHAAAESVQHLFGISGVSRKLWCLVFEAIGVLQPVQSFDDLIRWVSKACRKTNNRGTLVPLIFPETVYSNWAERNARSFRNERKDEELLCRQILFKVHCRCPSYTSPSPLSVSPIAT